MLHNYFLDPFDQFFSQRLRRRHSALPQLQQQLPTRAQRSVSFALPSAPANDSDDGFLDIFGDRAIQQFMQEPVMRHDDASVSEEQPVMQSMQANTSAGRQRRKSQQLNDTWSQRKWHNWKDDSRRVSYADIFNTAGSDDDEFADSRYHDGAVSTDADDETREEIDDIELEGQLPQKRLPSPATEKSHIRRVPVVEAVDEPRIGVTRSPPSVGIAATPTTSTAPELSPSQYQKRQSLQRDTPQLQQRKTPATPKELRDQPLRKREEPRASIEMLQIQSQQPSPSKDLSKESTPVEKQNADTPASLEPLPSPRGGSSKSSPISESSSRVKQRFADFLVDNNLEMEDIRRDGNCLFNSVSVSLFGTDAYHYKLRRLAVEWLAEHLDLEINGMKVRDSIFIKESQRDYTSYLRDMLRDGEWGTMAELLALVERFGLRISVLYMDKNLEYIENILDLRPTTRKFDPSVSVIWLVYDDLAAHYNLLRPVRQKQQRLRITWNDVAE